MKEFNVPIPGTGWPRHDEEFDTVEPKKSPEKQPETKTTQAVRDAHFYENGVKADGTGGIPPEEGLAE